MLFDQALTELHKELTDLVEVRPTLTHQTHYSIGAADQAEACLRRFIERLEKLRRDQRSEVRGTLRQAFEHGLSGFIAQTGLPNGLEVWIDMVFPDLTDSERD